jgi:hypothetical protein
MDKESVELPKLGERASGLPISSVVNRSELDHRKTWDSLEIAEV